MQWVPSKDVSVLGQRARPNPGPGLSLPLHRTWKAKNISSSRALERKNFQLQPPPHTQNRTKGICTLIFSTINMAYNLFTQCIYCGIKRPSILVPNTYQNTKTKYFFLIIISGDYLKYLYLYSTAKFVNRFQVAYTANWSHKIIIAPTTKHILTLDVLYFCWNCTLVCAQSLDTCSSTEYFA